MTKLKNWGWVFYGVGIAGIAILHFFLKGFQPIIVPVPEESIRGISIIAYLIAIGKNIRNIFPDA